MLEAALFFSTFMKPPAPKFPQHFDPRSVPVVAVDRHLPALDAARLAPQALADRFGRSVDWTPELAGDGVVGETHAAASVLIPIVLREAPTVLLTQRTAHLEKHSGQIAFPGGKVDAQDHDAVMTALRETREEIGLAAEYIKVLGCLPTYVTVTGFVVTPVVALVQPGFTLAPNADEVADVFEVPLAYLMNPANHRHHHIALQGGERRWLSMPYWQGERERFIWGVTASLLRNFYGFLAA